MDKPLPIVIGVAIFIIVIFVANKILIPYIINVMDENTRLIKENEQDLKDKVELLLF